MSNLDNFTDFLENDIENSPPISLPASDITDTDLLDSINIDNISKTNIPSKRTGEVGGLRSIKEIDPKYRHVFSYEYFNFVQSKVIEDALYSDKSMVVCAPTGSGKTVVFEMAIVQLLMEMDNKNCDEDFKIIYMAPIKALCTERLTEWYPKFTKLNLLCIEVTGDTDVDFSQLKPYRIIITTPEKWDMLTRRWRDNRAMVEVIKLFLIDEVHILNDANRGPVLEAVVSRMKTIQSSVQSAYRIEQLLKRNEGIISETETSAPQIRFVAVSATVSNPEDVAEWLGTSNKPAVYYKFGDECRPVKLNRIVEGYSYPSGTSVFKFDIILNYKLWPLIQKYHDGKPTLIFCNTRKSVLLTAETLSRAITINFNPEQKAKLVAVASAIKNKKIQSLILCGVGCHHAGLLYEERTNIEHAFRNGDLPILITTTTLAMGVNLPAHLVIIKNTQQYVNGAYQEYSISTVLQMVGRAGRPQFDTEATAVIMTRLSDKARYQALVGGCEPLQSYLHKRLAENLNSEAALGTVTDVAQCVQWLRSTFLFVRAARDPKKYLGLAQSAPLHLIIKKIEDLCIIAMNSLASAGLITMDEVSCIESTEAGRLLSIYYLDLETMKHIMKIKGNETLEQLLWIICESHELSDMHLRVDERRCLNALNRNNAAATIRFPMKGKISNRQMKLNCLIQAVLGCLPIHEPSLNQEAIKVMRIADRICKCIAAYVTRLNILKDCPQNYGAVLNSIILAKCHEAHLWENSIYVSKQLKGIGPTFSALLATAGKINFLLLEESHPRDLERIMNKGPPAGNVLRKQISLLPKYQLTITTIDENSVKLNVVLLNQMHLAENIEQLTAGSNHKCYIIVGDTDNHLIHLSIFKDKDLINIHDGQMTHNIIRRHNFEHKIIAHCISTTYAGIDVHCEYLFKSLEMLDTRNRNNTSPDRKAIHKHAKQTAITDAFKVRKRNNYGNEVICSMEKRKRDLPVIEKLKHFNKEIVKLSNNESRDQYAVSKSNLKKNCTFGQDRGDNGCHTKASFQNYRETNIGDDELIDNILNEIENEKSDPSNSNSTQLNNLNMIKHNKKISNNKVKNDNLSCFKNKKSEMSNFKVLDDIEKKASLFEESDAAIINEENTFAYTVKSSVDQYLEKTKRDANLPDSVANILYTKNQDNPLQNGDSSESSVNIISNNEIKSDNDDTAEYCKDMTTDNTLNVIENNDAGLELYVLLTEEKQNDEIDIIQNDNNSSIKELCHNYVPLPYYDEESVVFGDTESLNANLNHRLKSESLLKVKDNLKKNFISVLNNNTYSMPIPLTNQDNNKTKTQDIYEDELCFNNSIMSIGTDETKYIEKLPFKSDSNLDVGQIVNQDVSNIPLDDSTKKLSYTNTHINLYKNNNSDNNYCLIRKVKIDVDVIETLSATKEKDAVVTIIKESNENEKENGYLKAELNQCENSTNNLPSLKYYTNLNKTSNEALEQDDGTCPETINEYAENSYSLNSVSNKEISTVKGIIDKYKDIFSRTIVLSSQQDRQPISTPSNDPKNVKQSQKYKREYSITNLPNPLQSSNQMDLQHNYLRVNVNKSDNSKNTNTEISKHEQIGDNLLFHFDAVQHKNLDLTSKHSPTLDSGSPQCKLIEQSINNEYDLNQSMFNPKALLESFQENDVILPPPQFRDECNDSSKADSIFSETGPNSPTNIFNEDNTLDLGSPNDYNQYETTEITPSKEIETWTLARDDTHTELPKSSIMARNNSAKNHFLATSRKLKLKNFKYSRKNVLKLRK